MSGAAMVSSESGELTDIYEKSCRYGWKKFVQWPGSSVWDMGLAGSGIPIADFDSQRPARLVLTITLEHPTVVSTLQITPQIIGTAPKLLSLLVSRDKERWETIVENLGLTSKLNESLKVSRAGVPEMDYSGIAVIPLPERDIQYIRISLEVDSAGLTDYGLGHRFYYKVTEKHRSGGWFTKGKTWTEVERLPNPQAGIVSEQGDS